MTTIAADKPSIANTPRVFDPRSAAFRTDPYPGYAHLRRTDPIHYRPERDDWVLTRYEDVATVLKSREFGRSESNRSAMASTTTEANNPVERLLRLRRDTQHLMSLWLVLRNPPDHSRLRKVMRDSFSDKRIQALRTVIQQGVDAQIDRVDGRGGMDLIADLAWPLTLDLNLGEIMGIPRRHWHPDFKTWSDNLALLTDLDITPVAAERGLLAATGLIAWFRDWVARCRTGDVSAGGLVQTLIQACSDGLITEDELIANCLMQFGVGHSSTSNLMGLSVLTLLRHPQQWQRLRADPTLVESAIAEVLRYDSAVQGVARTALADTVLAGQPIRRGQVVNCIIGAANRDPEQFPDPDRFDIERKPNAHLSFGTGIHVCLGRHLGRIVAETTVNTLLRRLPGLALADEPHAWEESYLGRGLKSLPLVF